jgi:hypothetical protein
VPVAAWLAGVFGSLLVLVFLFTGVAAYTDQPTFCASCHEMKPYVDAWARGPHSSTWCVDCHVGKSYPARLAHKFAALKEVVAHFSGDTRFPRPQVAVVADGHCSACHQSVNPAIARANFDHAAHASRGPCETCHGDAGHNVTSAALSAAGAYNPAIVRVGFGNAFATVGAGQADVAGHVKIACTRCHDLAKTGCDRCHTPPHQPRGTCLQCHRAEAKWAFHHPTQAACEQCHTPSATHFKPASGTLSPCTRCHTEPGKAWTFTHPRAGADCQSCHTLPNKHFQPASGDLKPCSQCHAQPGRSWAFTHPGSSADCRSCHTPPSGHSSGQCSQCHHKTGVSFAFVHPSTSMPGWQSIACVKCHPSGYTTHSCTCHG